MINPVITFDKQSVKEILYCFDKSIDEEGYVIGIDGKRVLAMDGKEIKASDIGGITKEGFVRNDIVSLIELSDMLKEKKL